MSDEIDRANDVAAFNLHVALTNRAKPNPHASFEFCDFCGNPIPEARRLAVPGVELCVDCQRADERSIQRRHSPHPCGSEFREKYR